MKYEISREKRTAINEILNSESTKTTKGLKLDEKLRGFNETTIKTISEVITITNLEVAAILQIKPLEFNCLSSEQEYVWQKIKPRTIAATKVHDNQSEWSGDTIIKIYFLNRVASALENGGEYAGFSALEHLRRVIAHEGYHPYAKSRFNIGRSSGETHDDWLDKRVELAAEHFAHNYTRKREVHGWKERVFRFFESMGNINNVLRHKEERRNRQNY